MSKETIDRYKGFFNKVKSIVPQISETELIALRTGNTHLDAQIFKGSVSLPSVVQREELNFNPQKIDNLLDKFDPNMSGWSNIQANGYDRIWDCGNLVYTLNAK